MLETGNQVYISSGLPELARVLGGGIVEGALMLVGGVIPVMTYCSPLIAGVLLINASELAPELMDAYHRGAGEEEARQIILRWRQSLGLDLG